MLQTGTLVTVGGSCTLAGSHRLGQRAEADGQKFTGSANGITTKIPRSAFTLASGVLKVHKGDNGSGTLLTREFCGECGSGILEYGVSSNALHHGRTGRHSSEWRSGELGSIPNRGGRISVQDRALTGRQTQETTCMSSMGRRMIWTLSRPRGSSFAACGVGGCLKYLVSWEMVS
jgi:hypothetical protein